MGLGDKQRIFTKNVAKLIMFAYDNGIELTFGEAYRTKYQQEHYVITGKSKTMNSKHLSRLAVDFNFFINGELTYNKRVIEPLGIYWESLNDSNKWGGHFTHFTDVPHFQMS